MYPHRVLSAAGRELYDVGRGATTTHRQLRDRVAAVAFATVGVDLVCALLAFLLERHGKQTQIKTVGSALFWTSTQLLTVSSSLQNPVSTGGRVLDVLMEVYAITVVAALAGSLGAFFQKRGLERAGEHKAEPLGS